MFRHLEAATDESQCVEGYAATTCKQRSSENKKRRLALELFEDNLLDRYNAVQGLAVAPLRILPACGDGKQRPKEMILIRELSGWSSCPDATHECLDLGCLNRRSLRLPPGSCTVLRRRRC